MFYAYAERFNVRRNLENFLVLGELNQAYDTKASRRTFGRKEFMTFHVNHYFLICVTSTKVEMLSTCCDPAEKARSTFSYRVELRRC